MSLVLFQIRGWLRSVLPHGNDDRGASVVEYAMLVALIFAVLVVSVNVIGTTTSDGLDDAGSSGFVAP